MCVCMYIYIYIYIYTLHYHIILPYSRLRYVSGSGLADAAGLPLAGWAGPIIITMRIIIIMTIIESITNKGGSSPGEG